MHSFKSIKLVELLVFEFRFVSLDEVLIFGEIVIELRAELVVVAAVVVVVVVVALLNCVLALFLIIDGEEAATLFRPIVVLLRIIPDEFALVLMPFLVIFKLLKDAFIIFKEEVDDFKSVLMVDELSFLIELAEIMFGLQVCVLELLF